MKKAKKPKKTKRTERWWIGFVVRGDGIVKVTTTARRSLPALKRVHPKAFGWEYIPIDVPVTK